MPIFYEIVQVLRKRLRDPRIIRISGYGHLGIICSINNDVTCDIYIKLELKFENNFYFLKFIGDGNIHVQVSIPEYYEDIASQLEPFIFEYVSKYQGSVSAEHGIGFKKVKYLHLSRNSSEIKMMHDLKKLMDPNGILNPYKVLQPIAAAS